MIELKNLIFSVTSSSCPICDGLSKLYDRVDFSKNCEDRNGLSLPQTGLMVGYNRCDKCSHIFAPCFYIWLPTDYSDHIYNNDYIKVDPEYISIRPTNMAEGLHNAFSSVIPHIDHLDYGGGDGLMSNILKSKGWKSESYDPYGQSSHQLPNKKYNFITAFEVLEHTIQPIETIKTICSMLDDEGILMLTTGLTDQQVDDNRKLSWWYFAPRNGHISIFSSRSISLLAEKLGFNITYFEGKFIFYKKLPSWLKL
jgi:hypothetical protein